jgi:5-methylcytosine-specific restriction protein A
MGKTGDQDLYYRQNKTLLESRLSGIEVHLFEVKNPGDYEYRGQVYLADKVYQEEQRDDNGFIRKVWMFPLALK